MPVRFQRRHARAALLLGATAVCLTFAVGATSPRGESTATPSPATPSTLTIDITIADGNIDPTGLEVDASVGQGVILNVESDIDDELHAHMGLDGYALAVYSGQTTTGRFRLRAPGTFLVESHYLGKTIVIMNVR
jgi:hypothetical protein